MRSSITIVWLMTAWLSQAVAQDPFEPAVENPFDKPRYQTGRLEDTQSAPLAPQPDGIPAAEVASRPASRSSTLPAREPESIPSLQPSTTRWASATLPVQTSAPARLSSPKAMPLAPLSKGTSAARHSSGGVPSVATLIGSLAVVAGLFLLATWVLRRTMPQGAMLLPRDVVEVLGRCPLTKGNHAHLVRCGNKLLLISISTGGAKTLTEITDPVEIDRIAGICMQSHFRRSAGSFRQGVDQFSDQRTASRKRRDTGMEQLDLSAFAALGSPSGEDEHG